MFLKTIYGKKSRACSLCGFALTAFLLGRAAVSVSADEKDSNRAVSEIIESSSSDLPASESQVLSSESDQTLTSETTSEAPDDSVSVSQSTAKSSGTVSEKAISSSSSSSAMVKKDENKTEAESQGLITGNQSQINRETLETKAGQIEESKSDPVSADVNGKMLSLQYNGQIASGESILFAVWSEADGQDDLVWYNASVTGAAYIDLSKHKAYGVYNIHTYSNIAGKMIGRDGRTIEVSKSNPKVTVTNPALGQYQVTLSNIASDISSISLPIWSNKDDQDDIKWYTASKQTDGSYTAMIHTADHKADTGSYTIHVYGQSVITGGMIGLGSATFTNDTGITNHVTADLTKEGIIIQLASNQVTDFSKVNFAVWSQVNDQDDLKWYSADSRGRVLVPYTNHTGYGTYNIHTYGTVEGSYKGLDATSFDLAAPSVLVKIEQINDETYQVVIDNVPYYVAAPSISVWTSANGQDDIEWLTADQSDKTSYRAKINLAKHNNEKGHYNVHVYGKELLNKNVQGDLAATAGFDVIEKSIENPASTESAASDERDDSSMINTTNSEQTFQETVQKSIEIKDINAIVLYSFKDGKATAYRTLSELPSDISNYFVKVTSDKTREWLLPVTAIVETVVDGRTAYQVTAEAPALVSDSADNSQSAYQNGFSFIIEQPAAAREGVYTTFSSLIEAMAANPSGDFIVGADLYADEYSLDPSKTAYITATFKGTLTGTYNGHRHAIYNLAMPLFNVLSNATIKELDLKNVSITTSRERVGALASTATKTTVSDLSVEGSVTGGRGVGGIVYMMSLQSQFDTISFKGTVTSTATAIESNVGGIAGANTASAISNAYVDAVVTNTGATAFFRTGGIVGWVNGANASVKNAYVKGQVINKGSLTVFTGGIAGSTYSSSGKTGLLSSVVSEAEVINGNIVNGYVGASSNNMIDVYTVESKASGTSNSLSITITSEKAAELLAVITKTGKQGQSQSQSDPVAETQNYSLSTDYMKLKGAKEGYETAYNNAAKLMPLYNKDLIVKYANKIDPSSKLYSTELISVTPLADKKPVSDIASNKTAVNHLLLYYADGSLETLDVTYTGDFEGILAEYAIADTGLIYTSESYLSNYDNIIAAVSDKLKAAVFNSKTTAAILGLSDTDYETELAQLYLQDSFTQVQANIDAILRQVLSTSASINNSGGVIEDYLIRYITDNAEPLLLGLAYMNRWYTIDFDGIDLAQLLSYNQDFYGTAVNSLEWLVSLGRAGYNAILPANNLLTYANYLAGNTKQAGLIDFLSFNRQLLTDYKTDNDWFKATSKATIVEAASAEAPNEDVSVWSVLTNNASQQNGILPLLTAQQGIFIITTIASVTYGMYDRYSEYTTDQIDSMIAQAAEWQKNYFDTWYRLLGEEGRAKLLAKQTVVWDGYLVKGSWQSMYGNTSQAILDFFGPVGSRASYAYKNTTGAYTANDDTVRFIVDRVLTRYGSAVFSHEMTHINDSDIYLFGYDIREGLGSETYTKGLLESAYIYNQSYISLNTMFDYSNYKDDSARLTAVSSQRYQSLSDIEDYVSGMMDVLYVLDYTEANAVLAQSDSIKANLYYLLENVYSNKEDGSSYISAQQYRQLTADEVAKLNLNSIDDLIDANIMTRRDYNINSGTSKTLSMDGYETVSLFAPIYAGISSDTGASSSLIAKQRAYEVLAAGGYEAYLGYLSDKYKETAAAEGKVFSDDYILSKLFDGRYQTWADFKKSQYKARISKLDQLQPITITYLGNTVTISNYGELQNLMNEALAYDVTLSSPYIAAISHVNALKTAVYNAYLRQTDDFRTSIFKDA
ncbi:ZmpA/ZmpB/ZmpC family metallo-endopeptidase [Streptococcus dentiloxodontae]